MMRLARGEQGRRAMALRLPELPITDRRTKPAGLLDGLANARGPLLPESKTWLRAVIENPTSETWERAHGLVLHRKGITLWHAVTCVDSTFPIKGPGNDKLGRRRPWARVPDQLTIVRAIQAAKGGRITIKQVIGRSQRGP